MDRGFLKQNKAGAIVCAYYNAQTAQGKHRAAADTETTAWRAGNLNNPSPHNAPGQKEQNRTK